MWQFTGSTILVVIMLVGATDGLLVVGPRFIRSNQDYALVLTNYNATRLEVIVHLEGYTNDGCVLSISKFVYLQPNSNKKVLFKLPTLHPGEYKMHIDGDEGFNFHKEIDLIYIRKSISGLLQLNKPVFKPGDTVQFRVIVLDTDLKPPANVQTVDVKILDPYENVIRRWSVGRLHVGVFEGIFKIVPTPLLGMWSVSVQIEEGELVSKTFEVKQYVPSTFEVEVYPTIIPLYEHKGLDLTISAHYYFGEPVAGTATLSLYDQDDAMLQSETLEVYGMAQVQLPFAGILMERETYEDVQVDVTFVEKHTNRTVFKRKEISVHRNKYNVELIKERLLFLPRIPYKCDIKLTFNDGTPAKNVKVEVTVEGLVEKFEESLVTDNNGLIKQTFFTDVSANTIRVKVDIENVELLDEYIYRDEDNFGDLKIEQVTESLKVGEPMRFTIKCSKNMSFLVYYVLSKQNIIETGYIGQNIVSIHRLEIKATNKMLPKSTIIVVGQVKQIIMYDTIAIDFDELRNNFTMTIDKTEVKPGKQIGLTMVGSPGSYVALAAYDQSLLQHNGNHDILRDSIVEVFDGFHAASVNEFDVYHSLGIFVRSFDAILLDKAIDQSGRFGAEPHYRNTPHLRYRTNFLESWLWKNYTIGETGRLSVEEDVPDMTTNWYLTGFSVHPVYGLGIIKKPLQFTTIQPFYIVENFPYSIKRGEVVELQFTLFSNLGETYMADVTMYNVANEMEFIGQRVDAIRYTKSVDVKPMTGVPISFLVKPRKLGEVTVRVKASIERGLETDEIVKVIRVTPESLLERNKVYRIFHSEKYLNESFLLLLDIPKKADAGSVKIALSIDTTISPPEEHNLENLLSVFPAVPEQFISSFATNVIVLDCLAAIDSNDTQLIRKATNLVTAGYQNQLRYRRTDGSFGRLKSRRGSVFLTAFVVMSMQTATKYIKVVDATILAVAFDWLASKQLTSGEFKEIGTITHNDMQGGVRTNIALTSYVLIAFMENDQAKVKHARVVAEGIQYVADKLSDVYNMTDENDAYDMTIATYAMMLNNHHSKETLIRTLLREHTRFDSGIWYWGRNGHEIEATGYALLALLEAEKHVDGIPAMRWLANQSYATDYFSRTQDTFVGLKALARFAKGISPSKNDYSVEVKFGKEVMTFTITPQDKARKEIEINQYNVRKLNINVGGNGFALIEVKYEYRLELTNYKNRFNLTVEKLPSISTDELTLGICCKFFARLSSEFPKLTLVEVNFPSGYVAKNNPITQTREANPIKHVDVRFGGTSVVVHYGNMGGELNCFQITAYKLFQVALNRPAYVLVYDYYDPKQKSIRMYSVNEQDLCDICKNADCPEECKN